MWHHSPIETPQYFQKIQIFLQAFLTGPLGFLLLLVWEAEMIHKRITGCVHQLSPAFVHTGPVTMPIDPSSPYTNSSSVAAAILVPFFALILSGFAFYLYKHRWALALIHQSRACSLALWNTKTDLCHHQLQWGCRKNIGVGYQKCEPFQFGKVTFEKLEVSLKPLCNRHLEQQIISNSLLSHVKTFLGSLTSESNK